MDAGPGEGYETQHQRGSTQRTEGDYCEWQGKMTVNVIDEMSTIPHQSKRFKALILFWSNLHFSGTITALKKNWIVIAVIYLKSDKSGSNIQGLSLRDVEAWPQVFSVFSSIEWQSNERILTTAVKRIPINPLHLLLTMRVFGFRAQVYK